MALMAMMIPSTAERPLDIPRCVMVRYTLQFETNGQMALVHDLAEA
jgi:putative hydrolase of HD superfamily